MIFISEHNVFNVSLLSYAYNHQTRICLRNGLFTNSDQLLKVEKIRLLQQVNYQTLRVQDLVNPA